MGLNYIPSCCESDLQSQALLGSRAQNKFLTECNLMQARWGWDEGAKRGINGGWAREMSGVSLRQISSSSLRNLPSPCSSFGIAVLTHTFTCSLSRTHSSRQLPSFLKMLAGIGQLLRLTNRVCCSMPWQRATGDGAYLFSLSLHPFFLKVAWRRTKWTDGEASLSWCLGSNYISPGPAWIHDECLLSHQFIII